MALADSAEKFADDETTSVSELSTRATRAESSEPLDGEPAENDVRPDWLPPNFKTPQALIRSYGEAQRAITRLGQENAELRAQLAEGGGSPEAEAADERIAALEQRIGFLSDLIRGKVLS